jgi:hypothetical protein
MSYIIDDDTDHEITIESLLQKILDELKLIRIVLVEGTGIELNLRDIEND